MSTEKKGCLPDFLVRRLQGERQPISLKTIKEFIETVTDERVTASDKKEFITIMSQHRLERSLQNSGGLFFRALHENNLEYYLDLEKKQIRTYIAAIMNEFEVTEGFCLISEQFLELQEAKQNQPTGLRNQLQLLNPLYHWQKAVEARRTEESKSLERLAQSKTLAFIEIEGITSEQIDAEKKRLKDKRRRN